MSFGDCSEGVYKPGILIVDVVTDGSFNIEEFSLFVLGVHNSS